MNNRRNYYRLLQVQPDAAPDVIKASYRTLMQKLRVHPDLGGDEWNAALLNEAYGVLSDPARRAAYDAVLAARRTALGPHARSRPGRPAGVTLRPPAAHAEFESLTCPLCRSVTRVAAALTGSRRCHACDSPLTRVTPATPDSPGERAVPRLERHPRVRFVRAADHARVHQGTVQDLSSQGMGFVTTDALQPGELVRLECDLLSAVARVVSCRAQAGLPERHAVGVVFVTAEFHRRQGSLVATQA